MALKYKPLLEILSPLVKGGRTGMLVITGGFGFKAKLYLRAGCVYHAECGHLVGVKAIRSIAKHRAVMTLFVADRGPESVARTRFSTDQVLYLFKQADQVWDILNKTVFDYDVVFELAEGAQYDSVEQTHQTVLSALDGCRTVRQVIEDTGLPEMDVLHAIYFYASVGLVRAYDPEKGDPSDYCREFICRLREELQRVAPPAMLSNGDPAFP